MAFAMACLGGLVIHRDSEHHLPILNIITLLAEIIVKRINIIGGLISKLRMRMSCSREIFIMVITIIIIMLILILLLFLPILKQRCVSHVLRVLSKITKKGGARMY
jgi:hypothetical protein